MWFYKSEKNKKEIPRTKFFGFRARKLVEPFHATERFSVKSIMRINYTENVMDIELFSLSRVRFLFSL